MDKGKTKVPFSRTPSNIAKHATKIIKIKGENMGTLEPKGKGPLRHGKGPAKKGELIRPKKGE